MSAKIKKATHFGEIKIGEKTIACAVLEDGTRVITQNSFQKALGKSRQRQRRDDGDDRLPVFLDYKGLIPFIDKDIASSTWNPILFQHIGGGVAHGYKATLLPDVCEIYLKARDAKVLPTNQQHVADECDIIIRALAKVGIIALVDEATCFQYERDCSELQRLLTKIIADDVTAWVRRFKKSFFDEYKRMYGLTPPEPCPSHIGHFINRYVYKELSPEVLAKLREVNPVDEKTGRRRHTHHQWFKPTGLDALDKQLVKVSTIMGISQDIKDFASYYERLNSSQLRLF